MKLLLDNRYMPLTMALQFLEESDVPKIVETYEKTVQAAYRSLPPVLSEGTSEPVFRRHAIRGSLETALELLPPLGTMQVTKHLFVPTRSRWVAYFQNYAHGGGETAAIHLAHRKRLNCRTLVVIVQPHRNSQNVNLEFRLYAPGDVAPVDVIRYIALIQEKIGRAHV